ncbi:hypothetical protein MUU46_16375 [Scandinavium sp. TWS1a]|uniref:hypothetical protein n=1 Tax=Scandinavium tedordense TaxID=2926521 RepID=UPI0013571486|nr:hypothetical protein [Scandinavium tedordense]MCS2171878.1 hypothetical protein [Scandinavium tedordense]
MKCQHVNKVCTLLVTLLFSILIFSGQSIAGDKIEHTEQVHYDMKSGEESIYTVEVSESRDRVNVLIAEVSPTLKPYSEFHFTPCLKQNSAGSVQGTYHLESANVEESDAHMSQIASFMQLQNLGVQLTELSAGEDLLLMKQNNMLISLNTTDPFKTLATCNPQTKSG